MVNIIYLKRYQFLLVTFSTTGTTIISMAIRLWQPDYGISFCIVGLVNYCPYYACSFSFYVIYIF